jgi:RNA polymerase sigma-70 factor (sigma-E family)
MTPSDELEFTAFVRARGDELLRYARWLVPDAAEAEDLLQVALLRLTRHWSRGIEAPEAYVRTTMLNLARDGGRRRHLVPVPAQPAHDVVARGSDHAEAALAQARLDEVLAVLPPRQRTTVVLRILEGRSEAETALAMGCSPGTVKSNLARGLDKVRLALRTATPTSEGALR